jgi:NAD(P)-dependent dehydrogenase (short-subunit alcohol dehydrogenase family)
MRTVLVTNVSQYAGPGVVATLLRQGARVLCHDAAFREAAARDGFRLSHPGVECLESLEPRALAAELEERAFSVDAVVSNDVYPLTPKPIGGIDPADLRNTFEAVFMFPVQLAQSLLPGMKARGSGSFVFITSARPLRPEKGYAVPTSIRAGTTTFALAMAREVAGSGIQVNVVAPNYLYSEMYYPRARFIDDPAGRELIAGIVPMGRLGTPEEIGELVAFFVSGRSGFVTGQVIYFTGGWP